MYIHVYTEEYSDRGIGGLYMRGSKHYLITFKVHHHPRIHA